MKDSSHKRVSDVFNAKPGVYIFLVNGILLFAVMAYSLSQYRQKTSLQIVCGIITLVMSAVSIVTQSVKVVRLARQKTHKTSH